jgi:hypothetical protein
MEDSLNILQNLSICNVKVIKKKGSDDFLRSFYIVSIVNNSFGLSKYINKLDMSNFKQPLRVRNVIYHYHLLDNTTCRSAINRGKWTSV